MDEQEDLHVQSGNLTQSQTGDELVQPEFDQVQNRNIAGDELIQPGKVFSTLDELTSYIKSIEEKLSMIISISDCDTISVSKNCITLLVFKFV